MQHPAFYIFLEFLIDIDYLKILNLSSLERNELLKKVFFNSIINKSFLITHSEHIR
jgi:hypothetical protein